MRIFTVIGARPQFIKAAPLSDVLRRDHTEFLVHTGQHYDDQMSNVFFEELGIPEPDVNIGAGGGSHAEQTAAMLVPLEKLMQQQQPDWVLVYGDTNSTLAGALAAAKLNLRLAHVESGLRSYNMTMPEEVNRVLTDHVSTALFCPTQVAVNNLKQEGLTEGVVLTGDIMVDSVQRVSGMRADQESIQNRLGLEGPYVAVTIHRPANTDDVGRLRQIVESLNGLDMPVVFPVHPRTQKMLQQFGLSFGSTVQKIAPVGYVDMVALVREASVLITDSGGLQKEAYVLKTPCVTVRPETEWVETVDSGWNRLAEPEKIIGQVQAALGPTPQNHPDFYGDGQAAQRIVSYLQMA